MKRKLIVTLVAAAMELYAASLAQAACLANGATPIVSGPLNPIDGFPEFVTDSTGRSIQRCLDPVLCFFDPVIATDPFSVQIGSGAEAFYWSATAALADAAGVGRLTLVMAAESAFLQTNPDTGAPIDGSQFSFLRLRLAVTAPAAGTYTLVHPYGTEVFTVDALSGGRDVFNTIDVGFAPNTTVHGPVGPFLVWNAGAPVGFVGASGTLHAVTGSPCAVNSVTLTGVDLLGNRLNLDGRGGNVLTTNLFDVQGRLFDGRVQTPVVASRLTYSRPIGGLGQIDTFATSTTTAVVTVKDGPAIPIGSSRLPIPVTLGRATSSLGGAIDSASTIVTGANTAALPPLLAVTATEPGVLPISDPTTIIHPLVDFVKISQADYNPVTQVLLVLAASGDLRVPPTLSVAETASAPGIPFTTLAPPATVTVHSSAGGSDTAQVRVFTPVPPLAPTLPTALANPAKAVTLAWVDNSLNETAFQVSRATAAAGPFAVVATTAANATSVVDLTALPATTYFYQVVALTGTTPSTAATVSLTTPALPSASTAVTAVAAATGTLVTVGWADANANETGFQVLRAVGAGAFAPVGAVLPANSVSFVDTTALPATTYSYRVDVSNWAGTTASAASAALTTAGAAAGPVAAPTLATALASVARTVTLRWVDNSLDETGFIVTRSTTANGVFTQVATALANATSAADTTALPGTTYFYRVVAARGATLSTAATASLTTPALPSASTTVRAVAGASGTQVSVSWADVNANETGFQVLRRVGTGAFAAVGGVLPANSTSFVDNTAVPLTSYSYRVDVSNWAGTTPSAASPAVTTPAAVTLLAPTGLVASGNITLNWVDASTGETAYNWQRTTAVANATTGVVTLTAGAVTALAANAVTATSASTDNSLYQFDAWAVNGTTAGPKASVARYSGTATTRGVLPTQTISTTAVSAIVNGVTTRNVTVNWPFNVSTAVTGYELQRCTGSAAACATSGAWTTILTRAGRGTVNQSFADNARPRGLTYSYRIRPTLPFALAAAFSATSSRAVN